MNTSKLKIEIAKLKEILTSISENVGELPSEDSLETELHISIGNILREIEIMQEMVS